MKYGPILIAATALAACSSGSGNAEQQCLARVVQAVMNADRQSDVDTIGGATAVAKAEAMVLRSVSTKGCTAEQQAEIEIMADERQAVADVGQRLQDIRSGAIQPLSKAQELEKADNMVKATESYQKRFDSLVTRLRELADAR